MPEFDKQQFKAELKKSKPDKPIAIAFCVGKSDESTILVADAKKSNSKAVGDSARKESDGNKLSHGMCYLEKGVLHLQLEKDAGGAEKKIAQYLKRNGVSMKVSS